MTESSLTLNLAEFTEILPNLFVTGIAGIHEDNIRKHRIKCIVNVAMELPAAKFDGVITMKYNFRDTPEEDIGSHFDEICDKIARTHKTRRNVVVHCAAGCSRSVTIVLAYLMKYKDLDLRSAYDLVKHRRCVIQPNIGFFKQLIEYEKHLFGSNTVKMVRVSDLDGGTHEVPDVYIND